MKNKKCKCCWGTVIAVLVALLGAAAAVMVLLRRHHTACTEELDKSTISSWYRKGMVPTVPSLEKVCAAFGITLSQLFAEGDTPVSLTASQKKLLERWSRLNEDQQAAVFTIIDKMQ